MVVLNRDRIFEIELRVLDRSRDCAVSPPETGRPLSETRSRGPSTRLRTGFPASAGPEFDQGRRLRRDALPENTHYMDSGCDIHPSCLTCPLERCRYDEPGGARGIFARDRDREIVALARTRSLTIDAIARRFAVSRRTVFRVLARERAASGRTRSGASRHRPAAG